MKPIYAGLVGFVAALAAYAALPAADTPAAAETGPGMATEEFLCDDRAAVVGELTQNFHERPVAQGLQGNGTLLEVFASRETGTWTILVTLPTGVSCLTLVGDSWEMLPDTASGPRV